MRLDRRALLALAAAAMPAAALPVMPPAFARARKPKVPPGLDPGGAAVAIAGEDGLDYTEPRILARLARDGEGDVVGWDFRDDDQRPFAPAPTRMGELASLLLAEAGGARLVVFRTRLDTIALGRLMVFTGKGPARVLLLLAASDRREQWAAFAEAAAHFRQVLVIAPQPAAAMPFPAGLGIEAMLVVAACAADGAPIAAPGSPLADLAVPTSTGAADAAAARVAALAGRLVAAEPALAGVALKRRILALARPLPQPYAQTTRHGWIAAPDTVASAR